MAHNESLKNQFLVAMPNVVGGEFDHTVTFLCEHSESGAMGLVINRPTQVKLRDILKHIGIDEAARVAGDMPVYWGGPVQPERGFVLHSAEQSWDSTMKISEQLSITTSKDVLAAISQGKGPREYIVALGYAGWAAASSKARSCRIAGSTHPPTTRSFSQPPRPRAGPRPRGCSA